MNKFEEYLIDVLLEGRSTGGSPSQTGKRVGEFIGKRSSKLMARELDNSMDWEKGVPKKWPVIKDTTDLGKQKITPRKTVAQLKAQSKLIAHKVSKRQAKLQAKERKPGVDAEAHEGNVYAKAHQRYRDNASKGFDKGYEEDKTLPKGLKDRDDDTDPADYWKNA